MLFSSYLLAQENRARHQDDKKDALIKEETEDYYRKWLKEDVVYIITADERAVFEKLTTPEEKERFVEQFWRRRDPDLATSQNELKEEHYRRIAYANEHFYSGEPGWMTDRGRVYIIHGPPDQIQARPAGGPYDRPMHEGGGSTSTYPFEIWWYRHIEGLGSDIELEFVDRNGGNQYRLALTPEYKDALLHIKDAGATLAEELGIATKADRPFFSPLNKDVYPFMWKRSKDDPFIKYETFAGVQRPKQIKYKDLEAIVKVNVSYNNLPFKIRKDYFNLNDDQVIVPLTVEWNNKDLSFRPNGNNYEARIAVYGVVTSIQNRVVAEFEEEVTSYIRGPAFQQGQLGRSVYQKIVVLDKRMRYKLDLVVKDLGSEHVGVSQEAVVLPSFEADQFAVSSLMLSDFIQGAEESGKEDRMFVLGDLWIRPSLSKTFSQNEPVGVYLQLYNFGVDQASLTPKIEAEFRVLKDSKTVLEVEDLNGESVHYFSGQRIVFVRHLPTSLLGPGNYQLEVRIRDRIKDREVIKVEQFQLTSAPPPI